METQGFTPADAETQTFYRERVSSSAYLERKVSEIQSFYEGKDRITLGDSEKESLLAEEEALGVELEAYFAINPRSIALAISYLTSDAGRQRLQTITGEVPPTTETEVKKFLWLHVEDIKAITVKERDILRGESRNFKDKKLFEQLESRADDTGKLDVAGISVSESIGIGLDPDKSFDKISKYRGLKRGLLQKLAILNGKESLTDLEEAQKLVYEMYISKINFLIATNEGPKRGLREKALLLGDDSLTESEKGLLHLKEGEGVTQLDEERAQAITSRYDKFIYGATRENQAVDNTHEINNGWWSQISAEVQRYAEEIGAAWYDSQINRDSLLEAHGLDPEKMLTANVPPREIKGNFETILKAWGLLSSEVGFDPERRGPAGDGLWQVHTKKGKKSSSIARNKKVVYSPSVPKSKLAEIPTYGHELEHVVQAENMATIPLRLFKTLGGGGSDVFGEAGSMRAQYEISSELFGIEGAPHPHYIKGMITKLNGGTYLDVIKTFYESEIGPRVELLRRGKIGQDEFNQAKETALKLAIDRSRRIMSGAVDMASANFITQSKDTAYLEQVILTDKLKEAGLDFALDLIGVNLDNLGRLIRLGFLDPSKFISLDADQIKEIWDSQKQDYLLSK